MSSCCAVIVTYHPDEAVLKRLVRIVKASVEQVLIVNNGGDLLPNVDAEIIANGNNVGLSSALNQGITWAEKHGFSEVLLFDQDSNPAPEMVPELRKGLAILQASGEKTAGLGPVYTDARNGVVFPFVSWHLPSNIELLGDPGQIVAADFLITSGTLIPMSALRDVGPMDDGLFIDNVDTDWCARAVQKGYRMHGVINATMLHSIGNSVFTLRLPFGYSKRLNVHSSVRLYYIMRNRLLMYRRKHISWAWIVHDVHGALVHLAFLAFLIPGRAANLRAALRGLADGIMGKSGPIGHSRSQRRSAQ
jgi:rhamnosyltransferase